MSKIILTTEQRETCATGRAGTVDPICKCQVNDCPRDNIKPVQPHKKEVRPTLTNG
jgi:hypothetical protein